MVLIGYVTSRSITLVQLNFIDNVCQIFEDFMKSFQSDKPRIHRLYDVMGNLMIRLLLRFVKKKKKKIKNMYVTDLPDVDLSRSNRLQDSEISVGEGTRNGQSEQNKCLLGMRPAFGHSFLYSKEIAIQKQASC